MKNLAVRLAFMLLSVMSLCSCATMTRWFDESDKNKKMYTVYVKSKTKGLPVYYTEDGRDILAGYTPCGVYSDKAKIKYVTVQNGEEYQTVKLQRKARKSVYWNFFPSYTFLWGFIPDLSTGRGKTYGSKEYFVDM